MTSPQDLQQPSGLQIPEDISFQERAWRWQRFLQLAVLIFVVSGAFGVFGGGPLSQTTSVAGADLLRVRHPQFARMLSACDVQFAIAPELAEEGTITLWFERRLLKNFEIQRITPQPEKELTRGDRVLFQFEVGAESTSAHVVFRMKPTRSGAVAGEVGVQGGPQVRVSHFVYP